MKQTNTNNNPTLREVFDITWTYGRLNPKCKALETYHLTKTEFAVIDFLWSYALGKYTALRVNEKLNELSAKSKKKNPHLNTFKSIDKSGLSIDWSAYRKTQKEMSEAIYKTYNLAGSSQRISEALKSLKNKGLVIHKPYEKEVSLNIHELLSKVSHDDIMGLVIKNEPHEELSSTLLSSVLAHPQLTLLNLLRSFVKDFNNISPIDKYFLKPIHKYIKELQEILKLTNVPDDCLSDPDYLTQTSSAFSAAAVAGSAKKNKEEKSNYVRVASIIRKAVLSTPSYEAVYAVYRYQMNKDNKVVSSRVQMLNPTQKLENPPIRLKKDIKPAVREFNQVIKTKKAKARATEKANQAKKKRGRPKKGKIDEVDTSTMTPEELKAYKFKQMLDSTFEQNRKSGIKYIPAIKSMTERDQEILKLAEVYCSYARNAKNVQYYYVFKTKSEDGFPINQKQGENEKIWKHFEAAYEICKEHGWSYELYMEAIFDYYSHGKTKLSYPPHKNIYSKFCVDIAQRYIIEKNKQNTKYAYEHRTKEQLSDASTVKVKKVSQTIWEDIENIMKRDMAQFRVGKSYIERQFSTARNCINTIARRKLTPEQIEKAYKSAPAKSAFKVNYSLRLSYTEVGQAEGKFIKSVCGEVSRRSKYFMACLPWVIKAATRSPQAYYLSVGNDFDGYRKHLEEVISVILDPKLHYHCIDTFNKLNAMDSMGHQFKVTEQDYEEVAEYVQGLNLDKLEADAKAYEKHLYDTGELTSGILSDQDFLKKVFWDDSGIVNV